MDLRESFDVALKTAMKGGDAARVSTLRMILAGLKEGDIATRPRPPVSEAEIRALLRRMVKSREEAIGLYREGKRPELAAREMAEIKGIEEFPPPAMTGDELAAAVAQAISWSGAKAAGDLGKVMTALKAAHGGELDFARAAALVKARLLS